MRTQPFVYLTFIAFLVIISACNPLEVVKGRGEVISETRPAGTFSGIDASSDVDVYLTQGTAEPVRIEGQDNILEVLETFVRNNELIIRYKPGVILRRHEQVRIYVTNPELTTVRISGSAQVLGRTDWNVTDFRAAISGSGKLEMTLRNAEDVAAEISGSGNLYLKGASQTHRIEISGSGNVRAFELVTSEADVRISGSGSCELTVQNKLEAHVTGSGTIRYKGKPTVNTKITGSGRVVNVN